MSEQVYFNDWADGGEAEMLSDFEIDKYAIDGCTILCASYTQHCYEGDAYVLFEKDGKLFEVYGSHCSCYGLEGQWEPEVAHEATIRHCIENGTWGKEANLKGHVLAALNARRSKAMDELGALDGEELA